MSNYQRFRVTGENGLRGTVFTTSRFLDESESKLMRLEDGREFMIPSDALASMPDGSYKLIIPSAELDRYSTLKTSPRGLAQQPPASRAPGESGVKERSQVIPVTEERMEAQTKPVETGRVLVHKHVTSTESTVDEPLFRDTYDVRHVPVNRIVDHPPEIRHEGDTTIIPVLEEILVVEKRLVLREELHVKHERVEYRDPKQVTLRKEDLEVERVGNNREGR